MVLVTGGAVIGVVVPALRGEVGGPSTGNSMTSVIPGTTNLSALGYAVSAGVSGGTNGASPTTTVLGTVTETSTATTFATTTTSGPGSNQGVSPSTSPTQANSGRDIEFFSNLTLNVSSPSASLQKAGVIASAVGGYVASSTYTESFATVTVRVPAQNYETALSQLEALGSVVSASSSSNDVTVQYTDLNATLQSLLTEQTSLIKLLSQANSVNATLDIESVLQKTDTQINSVESSILDTAQLIDYATIGIVFQTPVPVTSVPLVVKLSATPLRGMSPLSVTFNALVSGGVQPYIVNFNFGDGTSAEGQQLIHQFTQAGSYNVTVSATDQSGNVSLAWIMVHVTSPPVSSGLAAFGGYVWTLFAGVVEGIIEVAAIVLPIFAVLYVGVLPAYRRFSKSDESDGSAEAAEKEA
jgi:PKD repeat protein